MSNNIVRENLHRALFRGSVATVEHLRSWALGLVTLTLVTIWKLIVEIDKSVYVSDFWMVVFGQNPMKELGPSGAVLLAFYLFGAMIWWIVTVVLVVLGAVWTRRMGLRLA